MVYACVVLVVLVGGLVGEVGGFVVEDEEWGFCCGGG